MRFSPYVLYTILIISPYRTAQAQDTNKYIEATIGVLIPQLNQTQTTVFSAVSNLQPLDIAHTQQAGSALTFSIGAGRQFALHVAPQPAWLSYYRLGLRYTNQQAEHVSGLGYWPSYAHMSKVYQFTYQVQSQFLLADLALGLYNWSRISTYLHLATGIAFVQASQYNETAGPDLPGKVSYGFSNQQSNKLGGLIGLGVDYRLGTNWHALITYDYFTPVTAALGNGTALAYATPTGPRVSLMNQNINLGLRYAF